ncbi:MAG: hypothetical protein ABH889_02035 [Candidatus Portnoybacteria bacterium]
MRTELLEFYDNLSAVSFSGTGQFGDIISILKVVSIIISSLLVIGSIILIYKMRKGIKKSVEMMTEDISAPGLPKKVFDQRWESVLGKLNLEDESAWKLAVIEADKIFDDVLKRIGYAGEDMGERLKQITSAQLANIEEVWQAHKMRNNIVHDPGYEIGKGQARRAIEIYQKALEHLEAL